MEVRSNGVLVASNYYDHQGRRVHLVTQTAAHSFIYDGWNVVLELVEHDDVTDRIEYFCGNDLSGAEEGAGGVGGLLAVSIDGMFYFPCYDQIGNVVCYVSEGGDIAAQYVYDPYGNVIDQYGALADVFDVRFSTRYTDSETGLVSYKRRFYRPDLGRWLNRDPIEEEGGENLYAFCLNNAIINYDKDGCAYFAIRGLGGGPIIKWSWFFTCPFMKVAVDLAADALNVELVHEQLFFEDGGDLSSIGGGQVAGEFAIMCGVEKIATDTYSFEDVRAGGFVYVDKTAILKTLADGSLGKQFFNELKLATTGFTHGDVALCEEIWPQVVNSFPPMGSPLTLDPIDVKIRRCEYARKETLEGGLAPCAVGRVPDGGCGVCGSGGDAARHPRRGGVVRREGRLGHGHAVHGPDGLAIPARARPRPARRGRGADV